MNERLRYVCSKGHAASYPGSHRPVTTCPVYTHGHQCPGTLSKLPASGPRLAVFDPYGLARA